MQLCDSVAVIRLRRPERGNSLDEATVSSLLEDIAAASQDLSVTGIVLTGEGRFFCAGGDIATLAAWHQLSVGERVEKFIATQRLVHSMLHCPVPIVAALNGPAAGAGVDLALAADARVAVHSATLIAAFASVGLVPDLGGSWFLTRRLGVTRALQFYLGGGRLSAEEAVELGLVGSVVEDTELMSTATGLLERLTKGIPRETIAQTLFAVRGAASQDLSVSLAQAARAQSELMATEAHRERVATFLGHVQ